MQQFGGNTGHGHVWPRPDGIKARCGGPAICSVCALDKSAFNQAMGRISHDDLCHLSRIFNEGANLQKAQDYRINEWLKAQIAQASAR